MQQLNQEQLKHYNELLSKYRGQMTLALLKECVSMSIDDVIQVYEDLKAINYYLSVGKLTDTIHVVHHMEVLEREICKELTNRLIGYYKASKQ